PAGIGHPVCTAKPVEGIRACPDVGERMVTNRWKSDIDYGFRSMAGKYLARWHDVEKPVAPSPHAGLGTRGKIVRHDIIDDHDAFQAQPRGFDDFGRAVELFTPRQQRRTVKETPAIILGMGDFDARRAQRL